jgi:cytidylate kinase
MSAEREEEMNYRVLTVDREFGSGGARIAKIVADQLGWKLLDSALIDAIACAGHVNPKVVSNYDEHVESWLRRMNRQAMRGAAMAAGVIPEDENCFDPDVMTEMTRRIIEQAHVDGDCVIVGRGAQCILQRKPDVFHVFVYAPLCDRVNRLRGQLGPGVNIEARIREVDEERAHYLRQRFGKVWNNPHLYDLMVLSHEDEDPTARIVLNAMTEPKVLSEPCA